MPYSDRTNNCQSKQSKRKSKWFLIGHILISFYSELPFIHYDVMLYPNLLGEVMISLRGSNFLLTNTYSFDSCSTQV